MVDQCFRILRKLLHWCMILIQAYTVVETSSNIGRLIIFVVSHAAVVEKC